MAKYGYLVSSGEKGIVANSRRCYLCISPTGQFWPPRQPHKPWQNTPSEGASTRRVLICHDMQNAIQSEDILSFSMNQQQASKFLSEARRGIEALRYGRSTVAAEVANALPGLLDGLDVDEASILAHEVVEEYLWSYARGRKEWDRPASAFNALVYHLAKAEGILGSLRP